jgi:SET domain-containing protein
VIDFRQSEIHGSGGFATQDIPSGTRLLQYCGEKIDKLESLRRCQANNPYIFYIDEDFDLDGAVDWNPARLLNHSCTPNCEAQMEEDDTIWIITIRDIRPSEEITFNYGYDLDEYREHPCKCGSPQCVGFIVAEEHHPAIRTLSTKAEPTGSAEALGTLNPSS